MRMTPDKARSRFALARVARLATVGADRHPHLVPVVFALTGDSIVTAVDAKPKTTTRLRRLANVRANPRVAVLVDDYDEDWSRLWWVRADGRARVVDAGPDLDAALRALAGKYEQYVRQPPVGPAIVVAVQRWTGWGAQP
jgi:PPOX class probable F420-dependent enzyme